MSVLDFTNPFDAEPVAPSGRSTRVTAAFAALFFALALAMCWLRGPSDMSLLVDNQHYFFIAERAASGIAPHVSQFDPKNALSLLITAAAIKASRLTGIGDDLAAARWISIVFASAAVSLLWLCVWMLTRRRLAAHLSAVIMLGFPLFFIMAAMGARPKVFLTPFLILPVITTAAKKPFWTGVFSAMAFLCWQPALIVIAGAGVAVLLDPRRGRRDLLRLALASVLTVAAYQAYFVVHGALAQELEQAYVFPRMYLTHKVNLGVWGVHAGWLFHIRDGFGLTSVVPVGFALGLAAVLVWGITHARQALVRARSNPAAVNLLIVACAALLFTLHDYQGFPDEFLVTPYEAAVCGSLLAVVIVRLGEHRRAAAKTIIAALGLVVASVPAIRGAVSDQGFRGLEAQRAAARAVGGFLERGDTVYAVGCSHLLAFNHQDNFVPYGFFFRGMQAYMKTKANSPEGYRPLDEHGRMPDIILESRGFIPGGQEWLETEYRDITTRLFARQRIRVWKRIDPARRWGQPVVPSRRHVTPNSPATEVRPP